MTVPPLLLHHYNNNYNNKSDSITAISTTRSDLWWGGEGGERGGGTGTPDGGGRGGVGEGVLEAIPWVHNGVDGGWFGRIGTSLSLLLGTFGNVMIIVILRRLRSGWSTMNVYLTFLALSDTAVLYTGTLPIWTRKVLRYDLFSSSVATCKAGIWVMNSSAALSAWLLVALTVQRAASVVRPHQVNLICTRRTSLVVIVLITLVCFSLYAHTLFGYQLVTVGRAVSCTFGSAEYQRFWVSLWVKLDMFIYSLLPCFFLVCSNAVLCWKLTVASRDAGKKLSAGGNQTSDATRKKKTSSVIMTMILVSTAFVVLTIPLMAYNSFFQDYASEDEKSRAFHYFLYEFFFVVGMSNFAWNFYLYCLTGSKFRQEFQNIMLECCCRCRHLVPESSSGGGAELSHVQSKHRVENQDDF